jgi:hypothetical protein
MIWLSQYDCRADDIDIKDAADLTKKIAADDIGSGKLAQRIKWVVGDDGVGVDYKAIIQQSHTYTGIADGPTVDVSAQGMKWFAMHVKGTGGVPTAWTIDLQTSPNNVDWETIETHASPGNTNGTSVWNANQATAKYFRSRVRALTLGPATNVVVIITGKD